VIFDYDYLKLNKKNKTACESSLQAVPLFPSLN